MKKVDDIASADSLFRIELFMRNDGTFAYVEFTHSGDALNPLWKRSSKAESRFGSYAIALYEARKRLSWRNNEMAWPARDAEPLAALNEVPDWLTCPACGIRFCMRGRDRWAAFAISAVASASSRWPRCDLRSQWPSEPANRFGCANAHCDGVDRLPRLSTISVI
ncbi:hypothetical protein HF313_17500 [Massilia atriviolacea]|uniref:Uncharacterized protein n=1 Tax=Massilia atriviolacea TaxID=2495579 RepID=A0A430HU60_9BURK|nr:hypothetical protein [Massilia atriviolacea]RSZ60914.1 hypothetical protein EJB06_01905 [Massilia atriviolacea]